MTTHEHNGRSIDYPQLVDDIRHELAKVYELDMNPALVLDAIDIIIHEQTGLKCVAEQAQRSDPKENTPLAKCDFVVLTHNPDDPSLQGPFEAWAYVGPLDFRDAVPLAFGAADSIPAALQALSAQLADATEKPVLPKQRGLHITPPEQPCSGLAWRVVYSIDVDAPDARAAAKETHDIMTDPDSLPPVLEVMDCAGRVVSFDLSKSEGGE
jgi:hypothetical protein